MTFFFLIHRARGCRKPWCKNRGRGVTGRCPSKIFLFQFIKHAVLNGQTAHTKGCLENRCVSSALNSYVLHVSLALFVLSCSVLLSIKVNVFFWFGLVPSKSVKSGTKVIPHVFNNSSFNTFPGIFQHLPENVSIFSLH